MTNSVDRLQSKRERLIAAACQMVYQQGIEKTTLADIATAAGVPLGNVYYYFRTKSDLVAAIVESHIAEARALLAAIDAAHPAPRDRLKAVFAAFSDQSEMITRYGCPQGSLCVELDKRAEGAGPAAELMRVSVEWAQRQFEAMGRPDAPDLAVQMIARYQGTALLTSTFRDPRLMARQVALVAEWIDDLDLPEPRPPAAARAGIWLREQLS